MKSILKSALHVFLRVLMVTVLAFASYPLVAASGDFKHLVSCILAVFYVIVLTYFNIFNLWSAGCKDKIKFDAGRIKPMPYKGFIASAIVYVPMGIVYAIVQILPKNSVRDVFVLLNYVLSGHSTYIFSAFGINNVDGGVIGAIIIVSVCTLGIVSAGIAYIIGFKGIKIIQPWLDQWKKN